MLSVIQFKVNSQNKTKTDKQINKQTNKCAIEEQVKSINNKQKRKKPRQHNLRKNDKRY